MIDKDKFQYEIITDRDKYVSLFDNYKGNKEEVFKHILDIRKFEIELYWKRTTFFWTIIASIIAGYALIFTRIEKNEEALKVLFALANLGLLFSIGWYFVNRGSKFWQVNWEKHMDSIEDDIIGPLYKTTINKEHYRKKFLRLLSPFPFSVSKINQVLNIVLIAFWVIVIIDFSYSNLDGFSIFKSEHLFFTLIGIMSAITIFSLYAFTQTEISNIFKEKKQSTETAINFEKRGLKEIN